MCIWLRITFLFLRLPNYQAIKYLDISPPLKPISYCFLCFHKDIPPRFAEEISTRQTSMSSNEIIAEALEDLEKAYKDVVSLFRHVMMDCAYCPRSDKHAYRLCKPPTALGTAATTLKSARLAQVPLSNRRSSMPQRTFTPLSTP